MKNKIEITFSEFKKFRKRNKDIESTYLDAIATIIRENRNKKLEIILTK